MNLIRKPFSKGILCLTLLLASEENAFGGEWNHRGKITPELRYFFEPANAAEQLQHWQPSIQAEVEFDWQSADRAKQIRFLPYKRLDGQDSDRSHGDIRELYVRFNEGDWQLTAGINKVFWGVSESRHLVDIVNQTDNLDDIDGEDKLGQPMISLTYRQDWGNLELYWLPLFREQKFVGSDGRLRPNIAVSQKPTYESQVGENHRDTVLRYSHSLGDFDIGAYWFEGTERQPSFELSSDAEKLQLQPHYAQIQQLAVDLQYTNDAWLWKLEALKRHGYEDDFYALVGGFEYSFYQLGNGGYDLGVLIEYLRDERNENSPSTLFQNDLFLGLRWGFNDTQNTALLTGLLSDLEGEEQSLFVEFERRLNPNWFLTLEGRFFVDSRPTSPQRALERDSFMILKVARYF